MSNFTTLATRTAAAFAAVFALSAQAGDITPDSLALMAAPWRPMAKPQTEQSPKVEKTAAADEAYDYDAPAGGWHVPGTPVRSAPVTVAARR